MKQTPLENLDCETITHDNRKETEQHNEVVGTFDVLAVESQRICITGGSLNVKCVSQIVFNSDVVGKKNLENLKQFHGHSSLYGEARIQALYLSNLNTPLEHRTLMLIQQHQDQFFKLCINMAKRLKDLEIYLKLGSKILV